MPDDAANAIIQQLKARGVPITPALMQALKKGKE
jgi:hypothetical protein